MNSTETLETVHREVALRFAAGALRLDGGGPSTAAEQGRPGRAHDVALVADHP
ncbi:MAG: hypothetical protein QOF49_1424 [Chloroflexota bacterium]|jgi:hypothetical protein|nr:hypothetical protein [Chloroflexota bacterium]